MAYERFVEATRLDSLSGNVPAGVQVGFEMLVASSAPSPDGGPLMRGFNRVASVYDTFESGGNSPLVSTVGTAGMAFSDLTQATAAYEAASGKDTQRVITTGDFRPTLSTVDRIGKGGQVAAFWLPWVAKGIGSAMPAPVVAPKVGAVGQIAGGVADDAFVNFGRTVRTSVNPTYGKSYWFRFGDIKHLTLSQIEALIGPGASAGEQGGAAVMRVAASSTNITRVSAQLNMANIAEYTASEAVTTTNVVLPR